MPRRGALLFPLLILLAGASLIREASVGVLAGLAEKWDALIIRYATPPAAPAGAPVTLVEINDDTTLKHVWPWGAQDFAVFFHATLPFGPGVFAVEPVLHGNAALAGEERESIYEKLLGDKIRLAPKAILGGVLRWSPENDAVQQELQAMPIIRNVRGDLTRVPEFTAVEVWAEETFRGSTRPGWTNLPDGLGARGRCPLVLRYRGQPVPAFALQLAMETEKVTIDEVEVVLGSHIALGKSKRVPIDDTGRMLVNFGVAFDRATFDEVLLMREQIEKGEAPVHPPAFFEKRTVILGRTDAYVRNLTTPAGAKVAPAEIFAAALATIHAGAHPQRIGAWFDWTLVGLAAVAAFWLPRSKAGWVTFLVIVATLALGGGAWLLFKKKLIILPGVLIAGLALWTLVLRIVAKKIQRVIAF